MSLEARALSRSAMAASFAAALAACHDPGPVDAPPVAFAGLDQVAAPNTTVTLDGSGSYDPDGAPGAALEYAWLPISVPAGSAAVLSDDRIATPTVAVELVGSYIFRLVVTDANGNESLPDVVAVTVNPYLEVLSVVPVDGAIDAPTDTRVVVILSEPVQPSTVNAQTVLLSGTAGPIDAATTLDEGNTVAVVRPTAALAAGTVYTLELQQMIRTLRGFSLAHPFASMFTTLAGTDATPPRVVSVEPPNGVGDVGRGASVTVTFSEPIERATVTGATFSLNDGSADVACDIAVTAGSLRATLTPRAPLAGGVSFTVTVTTGVEDAAGNSLAAPFTSTFSTSNAADTSPPAVVTVDPGDGFTEVAIQSRIVVTFSEPVSPSTVTDSTFYVSAWSGATVVGTITMSVGNTVATLTPDVPMAYETTFAVNVTGGVTDWEGNPVTPPFSSAFDTMAETSDLDRFEVAAAPTSMTVGDTATLSIAAKKVDGTTNIVYNNLLPVLVSHTGDAVRTTWAGNGLTDNGDGTASIAGGTFINGVASVALTATVPQGPVAVTVLEQDTGLSRTGTTTASGTDMTWQVGSLDHFNVVANPTTLDAGTPVNITITAADEFGNTIAAYANAAALNLTHTGTPATTSWLGNGITDNGDGTASIAPGTFFGGVTLARLVNDSAEGPVTITVTDPGGGATGSTAQSGTDVTWTSGGLVGFVVAAAPTALTAGQPTTVTIEAQDIGGNTITGYQNSAEITLAHDGAAGGAATVWAGAGVTDNADGTGSLAGGNFTDGVATVTVTNELAEGPVVITVTEHDTGNNRTGNTVASATNVTWTPGPVDYFDVAATPTVLDTSQASTIAITARDALDNVVGSYDNTNSVSLSQDGSAAGKLWGDNACLAFPGSSDGSGDNTLTAGCWTNGQTTVTLRSSVAEGPVVVTVTENDTPGASGTSPGITWGPGQIDHFYVISDFTSRTAGEQATITIEARDQFDNAIAAYDNTAAISLDQTGTIGGKIWDNNLCLGTAAGSDGGGDNTLNGGCWVGGSLTVTLENQVAEADVNVIVTENDSGLNRAGSLQLQASRVTWEPGPLDHFDVATSATSETAGQEVTLTITAQDVYGNALTTYDNTAAIDLDQDGDVTGKVWDQNACLVAPGTSDANGDNQLGGGCWLAGITTMTLGDTVAEGPVVVAVTENDTGSSRNGASQGITWTPGGLARFGVVAAPIELLAGLTSDVTITAQDLYGNVITAYGNTAPIDLTQNAGTTGISWAGLGGCLASVTDPGNGSATLANCFAAGVARIQIANLQAEGPVTIAVTENDTALFRTGNTAQTATNVTWDPGTIDHFWVVGSPTSLAVNSAASLTVQAEDGVDFPAAGRGNPIPFYVPGNPIDVSPSCAPTCAGSISYAPAGWDNLDDTATIPAAAFDGLGQVTLNATADFDSGGALTFSVTEQTTLETGDTAQSDTDISWLSAGCPAPTSVPEVVGGNPVATCAVALTGTNSVAPAPETIEGFAWAFVTVPAGSSVAVADLSPSATDPSPAFVADVPGNYVLELTTTNSCGNQNNKSLLVQYVPAPPAPGDVLITEVVTDPIFDWSDNGGAGNGIPYDPTPGPNGDERRDDDQWIEIYNATSCAVDLSPNTANPDGWRLLIHDRSGSETLALGSDPAREWFTTGSSLQSLLPGGYMVVGDPARGGVGGGSRMDDEVYLQLWHGRVGTGTVIDDVELDGPGGSNEENDINPPDSDGDGAPDGGNNNANNESVCRRFTPPYVDTDTDSADWQTSTAGATLGADNEP